MVELDRTNFESGSPLVVYLSSDNAVVGTQGAYEHAPDPDDATGQTNDNPIDNDDNGSFVRSAGVIRSKIVSIRATEEPTAEAPDNDDGRSDENENLTVDFGLYRMLSLGNRVWNDANNNGLIDER